jgi:hypothetical protein
MTTLQEIIEHKTTEDNTNITTIHTQNIKKIQETYSDNTELYKELFKIINKKELLEKDIDENKRKLDKEKFTHGAKQSIWKQVIYDNQKYEDKTKFYYIVSTLHFFIIILVVLGFFDFINGFLITIGVFILYLIIIGVFVVKMDYNRDRNDFDYNKFNIKFQPTGVCNVKPTNVAETDENVNKENELNKITVP